MEIVEKLTKIEKKINMESFIINDENIWPIFRTLIGSRLAISKNSIKKIRFNTSKIKTLKNMLIVIIGIPIDIVKIFSKYDYIIFTTSDDYKNIDGKYINRLTNTFFENIEHTKILNIMKTSQNSQNKYYTSTNETIVDYKSLMFLVKLISLFINFKQESISIAYGLTENGIDMKVKEINSQLCIYSSLKYIYKYVFKVVQPKAILTTCYSNYQIVNIANSLGIKTIEFQHGAIIDHFAYSILTDVNSDFYPNYLGVLGFQDKNYLKDKFYIKDKSHIYCVGNMMVDYYQFKSNFEIMNLREEYEYIIAVSLQWTVAEETIAYVIKQAKEHKNICFVVVPRDKSDLNTYQNNIDNIKIFDKIDCYEIVSNSHYHMTVYSTCAYESLSLGTCNIFLNFNGLSEVYFSSYINENMFNFILEPNDDIMKILKMKNIDNDKKIINSNANYIASSYIKNINRFSKIFLQDI